MTTFTEIRRLYVNPHDKPFTRRRYVVSNEFGYIAIAFADCAQDALDTIVDNSTVLDSCKAEEDDSHACSLGNEGTLFCLDYIAIRSI